ncbi:MAG: alkaline phosphatase family protein [Myxococcota bacterium]|nr:alkaline phosphatase family protein [Myxococcota bacterium]
MKRAKVVLVVLDAFPFGAVEADRTPTLFALAQEGAYIQSGGEAVLSASTYPNHASLVTGKPPSEHGIFTSHSWLSGEPVAARDAGPASQTLFEVCQQTDRRSIALVGDQNLIGVCGASKADAHWPPGGELPDSAPRGQLGYGADRAVVESIDLLDPATADFTFIQLDEIDTARHLDGPWSAAVEDQCRATDAALGEILERIKPEWSETIVIAVSDHDHERVDSGAVDLAASAHQQGLDVKIDHDGTSALVVGSIDASHLLALPDVEGAQALTADKTLVWGAPRVQFGYDWNLAAQHGSPRTATQLVVVGGGHPARVALVDRIQKARPRCTDWAGWIRELMDLG